MSGPTQQILRVLAALTLALCLWPASAARAETAYEPFPEDPPAERAREFVNRLHDRVHRERAMAGDPSRLPDVSAGALDTGVVVDDVGGPVPAGAGRRSELASTSGRLGPPVDLATAAALERAGLSDPADAAGRARTGTLAGGAVLAAAGVLALLGILFERRGRGRAAAGRERSGK